MVAFRWIDRLIGLASIAVLARLLSPADFGIVGYAMLIFGLLGLFTGISTDVELIRHKHADSSYYSAAWTMNILRGLVVAVLMIALALPAAGYFREPQLVPIMLAFAAVPVIGGFENVGIVEFRKNLAFDREFVFLLTARVSGTIATIALALALRSYWALVAGNMVRTAFRVALSYGIHPFRPQFNLARAPEIFRFSRWMMLQNVALGIYEKLPGFVIGRELSSSGLAFFNAGKEIADLSATELRAPIRRALYPGFAQISDRREHLGDALVESTGMIALLTIPIPLGIALVANDLVPLFLGEQWQPIVAILQPLCIAAAITGVGTNSRLAYMALDRPHLPALAASIRVVLLLVLLEVVAPSHGVVGVAYAVAGVGSALVAVDYLLSSRILKIDVRRFLAVVWRPVTASLVMCAAVACLRAGSAPASNLQAHAWSLAESGLVGAAVYVAGVLGLWIVTGRRDGAERRILSAVAGARKR